MNIIDVSTSNSLWLAVEACIAIIAACLPTLGAFLKAHHSAQKSKSSSPGYKRHDDSSNSRNTWVPLNDVLVTSSRGLDTREEDEVGLKAHNGILVERSFESATEG
jgi:hypothetical protein